MNLRLRSFQFTEEGLDSRVSAFESFRCLEGFHGLGFRGLGFRVWQGLMFGEKALEALQGSVRLNRGIGVAGFC